MVELAQVLRSPWRRWAALGFGLAAAGIVHAATLQETDPHRGPKTGPGWGYYPAEHRAPGRPAVLLIGDSILSGYRGIVIARLRDAADVDAFINPFHQASPDLYPQLAAVLKKGGPYAVIHFNLGLHGWDKGRIPEGQYVPLTRKLVAFLQARAPTARLIWASTTPVTRQGHPGELDPAINPIILEQNRLAAGIMADEHVPVDDLYGLMAGRLALAAGDRFHWTAPGSRLQGDAVADAILAALARR